MPAIRKKTTLDFSFLDAKIIYIGSKYLPAYIRKGFVVNFQITSKVINKNIPMELYFFFSHFESIHDRKFLINGPCTK